MCFSGMIRGAIAFGLVLRLDNSLPNRSVIVSTSLSLVLVTTLIFGSSLGLISRCLFGKPQEEKAKDPMAEIAEEERPEDLLSQHSQSSYEHF